MREAKCLFVQDKQKQTFGVIVLTKNFQNLKQLQESLKLKSALRFLSSETIECHGINPKFCTPEAIVKINPDKIYLDSAADCSAANCSAADCYLGFRCSESGDMVTYSVGVILQDYCGVKIAERFEAVFPSSRMASASEKRVVEENGTEGDVLIGLTAKKMDDFPEWYSQVIVKSEMIEYYDVSGCYILRPWSYEIWENVVNFLDSSFKKHGVKNSYFPMFVTKQRLETEKDHVAGFSPEVAWVTKSGDTDLAEPIAIRPTSETIMYPAFAKWVRSHRDLPVLLNQWCSIVRWEFKHPTPFIRTREFLWQEGHTAHESQEEAIEFSKTMLEYYRRAYEECLACPVIAGRKSENEKFPGGAATYTVEGYVAANGRGLQSATSHDLGQNFSKMFDIKFEDKKKETNYAYQTSWGFTTRSIGYMIMTHGDDKGLILPPKVSPIQVVIIPIFFRDILASDLVDYAEKIRRSLVERGIRVYLDSRENHKTGWKYNHWDLKGVPLRIEVGPREVLDNSCRIAARNKCFAAHNILVDETLADNIEQTLIQIQTELFRSAKSKMESNISKVRKHSILHLFQVTSLHDDDIVRLLDDKKLILAPWCESVECEEDVKRKTKEWSELSLAGGTQNGGMKTLCIPFEQDSIEKGIICLNGCGPATCYALWGRSY